MQSNRTLLDVCSRKEGYSRRGYLLRPLNFLVLNNATVMGMHPEFRNYILPGVPIMDQFKYTLLQLPVHTVLVLVYSYWQSTVTKYRCEYTLMSNVCAQQIVARSTVAHAHTHMKMKTDVKKRVQNRADYMYSKEPQLLMKFNCFLLFNTVYTRYSVYSLPTTVFAILVAYFCYNFSIWW